MRFARYLLGFSLGLSLFGCGGGGTSTTTTPVTTPPTAGNTTSWIQGSFADSSVLQNMCEVPRVGNDPYNENTPYPDKQGTALQEKLWIRSYSHETYLWADELRDNDPRTYSSVLDYFNQLKTFATTESGKLKDQFHFSQPYDAYAKEAQSGLASGYGVNWAIINAIPPREVRVAYTQTDSVGENAGLIRGDTILAVDGFDINDNTDEGVAALNAGLAPKLNETHTFRVKTMLGEERDVTLLAQEVQQTPVQNAKVIPFNGKNVGYVQFNQFISIAQPKLIEAINTFSSAQIDALVLDMRYNGGGALALSSQLGYMVAGPGRTSNRIFNQAIDNGKGNLYKNDNQRISPFYNREINYSTYEFTANTLPNLDLDTVYILATGDTCSASESLINGLRGVDVNVVLIGETTCGKPYGFFPTPNCGNVFYTIQFKSSNEKGFGDYADGFSPSQSPSVATDVKGCVVADDFEHLLGSNDEALLSTALSHISTGQCPTVAPKSPRQAPPLVSDGLPIRAPASILQSNAIYLPVK
ncbi:S41 family peptidase [Pseudoalteromonas xiamenensis]